MSETRERPAFGDWLVAKRESKGLSCNRLALLADVSQSLLSKVERGERPATDALLAKLAPVLGVPLEELKREALRDRLTADELKAAAEIAAESGVDLIAKGKDGEVILVQVKANAPPEQAAEKFADQAAEWIAFNPRVETPEDEDKFWDAWVAVAEAKRKKRQEERGDR